MIILLSHEVLSPVTLRMLRRISLITDSSVQEFAKTVGCGPEDCSIQHLDQENHDYGIVIRTWALIPHLSSLPFTLNRMY